MKVKIAGLFIVIMLVLIGSIFAVNVGADGFGQVKGYVYMGRLPVKGAEVTAVSPFGEYTTETNWKGYYSLAPLELSKKGFANYDIKISHRFGDNETTILVDGVEWYNYSYTDDDASKLVNNNLFTKILFNIQHFLQLFNKIFTNIIIK
jgi:hypothetical protein